MNWIIVTKRVNKMNIASTLAILFVVTFGVNAVSRVFNESEESDIARVLTPNNLFHITRIFATIHNFGMIKIIEKFCPFSETVI